MGDTRAQLLDLSVDDAGAEARMHEVRKWFRDNGWSAPDPQVYDDRHSQEVSDGPGPRLIGQLDPHRPYFVFTFIPGLNVYFLGDSTAGPKCRQCDEELDIDVVSRMIQGWLDSGQEPDLTCPRCSWHAPWGRWELSTSLVVASFAVIIDRDWHVPIGQDWRTAVDPYDLPRRFVEELQADLGGHWVFMYFHD
ncbi:hypothetical protein [Arthrobacter sp. zg-Y1110]|uniref:hypothetical protein n=1 Tax=Arthrobacter sp. zg-Y1110 TaxID=2886932 RepID=UPI001D13D33D|nr:hypothetical protein [Arthrobacter sp. zg-Y1110]MCC3291368.1 hypothetical protein [Arthrobacter sp. zg-Y1110]UWX83786.1 hypothetical protein N2K99_09695 [Arthrobacter sp. zg-Y1110]